MIILENMDSKVKKCSYCGEEIEAWAKRCAHCGSLQDTDGESINDNKDTGALPQEDVNKENSLSDQETGHEEVHEKAEPKEQPPEQGRRMPPETPGVKREAPGQQAYGYRPYSAPYSQAPMSGRNSLSNGMKVFLTVLCAVIPGLGQLAGIIIAIVFMNTQENIEDYADRRSFGLALLIACIVVFVLACLGCFVLALAASFQNL